MRILIPLSLALALVACDDFLFETENLCEGTPVSAECEQCRRVPIPETCPQCRSEQPDGQCMNALVGTGGAGSGGGAAPDGGASGSGGASGTSGSGGAGGVPVSGTGGGSGADGGDACARCAATEQCLNGQCVECVNHDHCGAARYCTETNRCVQCLDDGHCGGATPKCVESHCVQCADNGDCGASAPKCVANACAPCTAEDDCMDRGEARHCELDESSPRAGRCVECRTHADCDNPEPQCVNGECMPCSGGNQACADRDDDKVVCNRDEDTMTFGQCVECTRATEMARCDGFACRRSDGTCTQRQLGRVTICGECEADSECVAGARCIPYVFDSTPLGSFCFWEDGIGTACAPEDNARRPYTRSEPATSVDGAGGNYCFPRTTCEALRDATNYQLQGPRTCDMASDCGAEDLDDGLCIEPDHPSAANKCSYYCLEDSDCPMSPFANCDGPTGGKFCQP